MRASAICRGLPHAYGEAENAALFQTICQGGVEREGGSKETFSEPSGRI